MGGHEARVEGLGVSLQLAAGRGGAFGVPCDWVPWVGIWYYWVCEWCQLGRRFLALGSWNLDPPTITLE